MYGRLLCLCQSVVEKQTQWHGFNVAYNRNKSKHFYCSNTFSSKLIKYKHNMQIIIKVLTHNIYTYILQKLYTGCVHHRKGRCV